LVASDLQGDLPFLGAIYGRQPQTQMKRKFGKAAN
jgi:hypothetical protein